MGIAWYAWKSYNVGGLWQGQWQRDSNIVINCAHSTGILISPALRLYRVSGTPMTLFATTSHVRLSTLWLQCWLYSVCDNVHWYQYNLQTQSCFYSLPLNYTMLSNILFCLLYNHSKYFRNYPTLTTMLTLTNTGDFNMNTNYQLDSIKHKNGIISNSRHFKRLHWSILNKNLTFTSFVS